MKQLLTQLVRQLGVINAGLYAINRFCSFFSIPICFIKYYFVAQILHQKNLLPAKRGKKLNIREISVEFQNNHPCPRPASVIHNRYAQGAVCLAAFNDEEFAGCLWYVKKKYQEDEVRCTYEVDAENSVWDFDVYVEPKYRLTPVFLKMWDNASQRLLDEGYQWSISRISAFNPMSLSSHKRMGAQQLGWAVFFRVGFSQFTLSNLSPYLHISINTKYFPVFKLKIPN